MTTATESLKLPPVSTLSVACILWGTGGFLLGPVGAMIAIGIGIKAMREIEAYAIRGKRYAKTGIMLGLLNLLTTTPLLIYMTANM